VASRLKKHNAGGSPHTARFKPWELVATVGVQTKEKAAELEHYFKSGSGHTFAHKHLW
jgi:putative endonuclease